MLWITLRTWLHKFINNLIIQQILNSSKIRLCSTLPLPINSLRSYSSKITGKWCLRAIKKCKLFLQSKTSRKCRKYKWDRFRAWDPRLSRPWKLLSNSLRWENSQFIRATKQLNDNHLVSQTRATELIFHTKARRAINLPTRRTTYRKFLSPPLFWGRCQILDNHSISWFKI